MWEQRTIRLARAYVRIILLLVAIHLSTSLVLHLSVWADQTKSYQGYSLILFRYGCVIWLIAGSFVKNSFKWMDQVKSCPTWLWLPALFLGLYPILLLSFRKASFGVALTVSGVVIGFDAISFCVLYPVIRSSYLKESEVVQRTLQSFVIVAICVAGYMAYQYGYLHGLQPQPSYNTDFRNPE